MSGGEEGRDRFLWGHVPARPGVCRLKANTSRSGPQGPPKTKIKSRSVGALRKDREKSTFTVKGTETRARSSDRRPSGFKGSHHGGGGKSHSQRRTRGTPGRRDLLDQSRGTPLRPLLKRSLSDPEFWEGIDLATAESMGTT